MRETEILEVTDKYFREHYSLSKRQKYNVLRFVNELLLTMDDYGVSIPFYNGIREYTVGNTKAILYYYPWKLENTVFFEKLLDAITLWSSDMDVDECQTAYEFGVMIANNYINR